MLSSVSSSSTITLHLLNRHQTCRRRGGGADRGFCWLPRDHVSTDLHLQHNQMTRVLLQGKCAWLLSRLFLPPSPHFSPAPPPSFLIKTSPPFSQVYPDILRRMLLFCNQGYYFQGLPEARRRLMSALAANCRFYADKIRGQRFIKNPKTLRHPGW